jgi:predicted RNA-binding protein associated with RNAse of E/G family
VLPRNAGSIVDTSAGTVRDRDGAWSALDRLVVEGRSLYYARPVPYDTVSYHERWLLADESLSFSRFRFSAKAPYTIDWYVEPDLIQVEAGLWTVRDGYVDLEVHDGSHYRLDDADELADGMRDGEISLDEACAVLRALDRVCDLFRDHGYSGAKVLAVLAPGLAHLI